MASFPDDLSHTKLGPNGEFATLEGKCFSIKQRQCVRCASLLVLTAVLRARHRYTYEICPYDKARQKEGHSETNLGTWKGWDTDKPGDGKYSTMLFKDGDRCWQGPERSMTVRRLDC